MLKRTRRLGLLIGTVVMLSTLASATSAGAQQAEEPADDATVAQVAPSCIERYWHTHSNGTKEAHATSFCVGTYYIKFIIAYGPDSGCYRVGPGQGAYWWWRVGWPYAASRLDRLELC